jgi:hypothetical protein
MHHNRIVRKHTLGSEKDSLLAKLMRQHKLNHLEACSLLALLTVPRYQILATNEQVRMAKKMARMSSRKHGERLSKIRHRDYGKFVIGWLFSVSKEEERCVVEAVDKLLPSFNECRRFISELRNRRMRVSTILEYPFLDPHIRFEVWHDETIPAYGVHIWENIGNWPLGAVHFKHQKVWI